MVQLITAVLLLVAWGFGSIARAENQLDPKTSAWGEIAKDGDCQIRVEKDKMIFDVPGTAHDFAAELKRWNAPHVLSEVEGDFVIDVKISGKFAPGQESTIEGRYPYNGAGLLLVQDEKNHLSLQRGAVRANGRVRHYLNFELRKNSADTVSRFSLGLDDQDTYLRIERCGNLIYGLGSADGAHWRSYEPIKVSFPKRLKVGVVAVTSSSEPFACAFEGLRTSVTATNQTGVLEMFLVRANGTVARKFSQSFAVGLSGNNVLSFTLPDSLAPGNYSINGRLVINAGVGQVPAGVYSLPAQTVTLSAGGTPSWSTNGFSLVLKGPIGSNYVIEATSDLSNATNWRPILYFSVTNSPVYLSDPTATNYVQRFYRAMMQQ